MSERAPVVLTSYGGIQMDLHVFRERVAVNSADDEVTQRSDIHQIQRQFEPPGPNSIGFAGLRQARGVIVRRSVQRKSLFRRRHRTYVLIQSFLKHRDSWSQLKFGKPCDAPQTGCLIVITSIGCHQCGIRCIQGHGMVQRIE
jgi:hypothetical protein